MIGGHISGQGHETHVCSAELSGNELMMWSVGGWLRQKKIGHMEANWTDGGKSDGLRQIVMHESEDAMYCRGPCHIH